MAAIFACIVQPKVIEFNVNDHKLHRAQKDEELRAELQALSLPKAAADAASAAEGSTEAPQDDTLCQAGGGCRLLLRDSSVTVASVGSAFCVFEGTLSNAAALAEVYAPVPEDEPIPSTAALSPAELACRMYAMVGVEMLGLLRGAFTFVLYESKTSRVLAARDGSGMCPLLQARSARDSLVLSNSRELLEAAECHDVVEFLPGDYKYGWSAVPRRYQPADHARLSRRSLDLSASANHHNRHNRQGQPPSRAGSRRPSLDHHDAPAAVAAAAAAGGGSGAGGAAAGAAGSRSRRTSLDHQGAAQGALSPGQGPASAAAAGGAPHPHPHRTYVVSAEDPRILKAGPARSQQEQQQQQAGAAVAGAPRAAAAAAGAAAGSASDNVGQAAEGGRGGSARGATSGHHNRRRSMDNHGAWRLGTGQAADKQQQGSKPQQPQPQQAQQQQCAAGGNKHEGHGRRRGGGWDGCPGHDGRSPNMQQQQSRAGQAGETAAAAAASPAKGVTSAVAAHTPPVLRVDAPVFTPPWAATAVSANKAVAVGSSP